MSKVKIDPTNLREIVWGLVEANEKLTDTIALQNDRITVMENLLERNTTIILGMQKIILEITK